MSQKQSSCRCRHLLMLLMLAVCLSASDAFTQRPLSLPSSALFSSKENVEEPMSERERMKLVRNLQKTFYNSPSVSPTSLENDHDELQTTTSVAGGDLQRAYLDRATGIVHNLPLWRVGWVEVPGRTNCLNVHEGQYTHMFETILNGPKPWYVGHLHLPGGFKMTRTGEHRFQLKSWKQELQDKQRYQQPERSAVVGCLMQITDYRRLQDGRLCLLVQTLERFVVDSVVQEFPYSVANVQILPDQDEYPKDSFDDENFARLARGSLVSRSFDYHPYEFYPSELPLNRNLEYLETNSINKQAIAKLLPFATYSLDESLLNGITEGEFPTQPEGSGFAGASKPLEQELEHWRILQEPPSPQIGSLDTNASDGRASGPRKADLDGLETLLWLALEDLVRKTGFILPTELLTLQPPHMDYLDLAPTKDQGTNADAVLDFMHLEDAVPKLSPKYPSFRRQKRLSYTLPALLESSPLFGANLRQTLLNTPSTKARLSSILERLELINSQLNQKWE